MEGLDTLINSVEPGATIDKVTPLTGGVSADVYRVDLSLAGGGILSRVIRIHSVTGGLSNTASSCTRTEYTLLQALADEGLPVPKPLVYGDADSPLGRSYLLMSYIEGSTMFPGPTLADDVSVMAQCLADIHSISTEKYGFLPSRLEPLPELLEYLPTGSEGASLRDFFSDYPAETYESELCLLHGDFWKENLLWKGGKIVGILDWEDAAIGDPHCDIAAACVEISYFKGMDAVDALKMAYRALRPLNETRFQLWRAYVAAAAQKYVADWGVSPEWEAHVRDFAGQNLRQAATALQYDAVVP